MKKLWIVLLAGGFVTGCSNAATDGKANTDTTNMITDTNLNKSSSDHVNRNFGEAPTDTSMRADSMRK